MFKACMLVYLMQYEINPACGGSQIFWPDSRKFNEEHAIRFTAGNTSRLLQHTVGYILAYLPHEIVHAVQTSMKHYISPECDDGWLAEHDPSACSLNILKHSLEALHLDVDDDLSVPGVFESVVLYLVQATKVMYKWADEHSEIGYCLWRDSYGYQNPKILSASIMADYAKVFMSH